MNITVTVDDVSLDSLVSEEGSATVADLVAAQMVQRIVSDHDYYSPFRNEVTRVRDEVIREAVTPLIEQALAGPFHKTNSYGEPTGAATTLREVIADQARKALNEPAGDRYGSDKRTLIQKIVAEEISKAFGSEIADEVRRARESVGDQIGDQVAAAVKAGMQKR